MNFLTGLLLSMTVGAVLAQPRWMTEQEQPQAARRQEAREMRRGEMRAARDEAVTMPRRGKFSKEVFRGQDDAAPPRQNNKMSPDERRALRRQISEANRSLPYGR